ncbi:MAG: DUF6263 family protein [Chitinophagaceae bacterium]
MKRIRNLLWILCLLPGLSRKVSAQQTYSLQYHFSLGDHFSLRQKIHQETYLTYQGISHRTTQQFNATLLFALQSRGPDQSATFAVDYQKIQIEVSGDNQQMSVNTQTDGQGLFQDLFKKVIGQLFYLTLSSYGSITDLQGLDPLFSAILKSLPDHRKSDLQALKKLLTDQFSSSALQSNLEQVLPYYPAHEVGTGNSWEHSLEITGSVNGQLSQTWTLEYGDPTSSQLTLQGSLATNREKIVPMGRHLLGTVDLTGTMQGNEVVDMQSGWPTLGIRHDEFTGHYTYHAGRGLKKQVRVPLRIVIDTQTKILHL